MKKFLSLLLVVVLVSAMFVVPVSADDDFYWAEGEYELTEGDNNVDPYHAWGYEFKIDTINTVSSPATDTVVFTNADDYLGKGGNMKWISQVLLAPTGEANEYEVIAAYKYTGKSGQACIDEGLISFAEGNIVLIARDSGTRPQKNDDGSLMFPNWQDRAAIWGLTRTIGAKATVSGIDVAAGTMTNGTITIEADPSKKEEEGGKVEDSDKSNNLVAGNKYEVIRGGETYTESSSYPDTDKVELTDGIKVTDETIKYIDDENGKKPFNDESFFGLFLTRTYREIDVIMPLGDGEALSNLSEIVVNVGASKLGAGIHEPSIKAYYTADGETWNEFGSYESVLADNYAIDVSIKGATVKANAIKLTFTIDRTYEEGGDPTTKNLIWVAEIEAYGAKADAEIESATPVPFFVTHIDGVQDEGWGVIFTENDGAGAWCSHVSFAPVEGLDGVYEVVEINYGAGDGSGSKLAVPAGGFVWAGHAGNPPYNNPGIASTLDLIKEWNPGDKFTFQNLDLEGKTISTTTPDKKWYEEGYVCTTTITAYVPGNANTPEAPKEDVEAEMKELLGEASADAKVDYVIDAPESYEAGDEITVTVTVKNI
ncbi:MAG: hypothetical protein IKU30_03330, partial [Clostridia bacterium]|nr:hypothetical protein [Clostridia bacterium]